MEQQNPIQTEESKYIQQHLANERTFLAWIRTAVAIIGIGFLAASYHFKSNKGGQVIVDNLAFFIGGTSLILGIITVIFSLYSYLHKRSGINKQNFRSSKWMMISTSLFMVVLALLYGTYFFLVY